MTVEEETAVIFQLQSRTYTSIKNNLNFNNLVNMLIMLDVTVPIIIEIKGDILLFKNLFKKFNYKASFLLNHINPNEKSEIDKIFSITRDFIFINYNPIKYTKNESLYMTNKDNIKIFYFKNFIISYTNNKDNNFISNILINHQKFKYKSNELFFRVNKNNKIRVCTQSTSTIDDANIYGEEESDEFLALKSISYYFDFAFFYMQILSYSFESLSKYTNDIIKYGEELKDKYLDISVNEKTEFYKNVLKHEENIYKALEELTIKENFIKSFIRGQESRVNKQTLSKIASIELRKGEYNLEFEKFDDKLSFYMQSFLGRFKDMELKVKKQQTIVEMIKKAIRIIIDDDKYSRERRLNVLIVILAIIQFLGFPIVIIEGWLSVNIKVPMKEIDNFFPFGLVILLIFFLPVGQLYIFYKFRNLIL